MKWIYFSHISPFQPQLRSLYVLFFQYQISRLPALDFLWFWSWYSEQIFRRSKWILQDFWNILFWHMRMFIAWTKNLKIEYPYTTCKIFFEYFRCLFGDGGFLFYSFSYDDVYFAQYVLEFRKNLRHGVLMNPKDLLRNRQGSTPGVPHPIHPFIDSSWLLA